MSVTGTEAFRALPEGRLSIQQAFEYQVAHCDSSGCTSSPVQTGYVSSALGAGERPGATRIPFTIGDRIGAQVDAGSGNLLVTAGLFSLPWRSGAPLEVGLAYNSLTRRSEAHFDGSVGQASSGWRLSTYSATILFSAAGFILGPAVFGAAAERCEHNHRAHRRRRADACSDRDQAAGVDRASSAPLRTDTTRRTLCCTEQLLRALQLRQLPFRCPCHQ